MKYEILENTNMRLTVDNGELDDVKTTEQLLDSLIAHNHLCWISPSVCGDLTDAPILALLDYPERPVEARPGNGWVVAGFWSGKHWSHQVLRRWGWMQYETKDLLEELREKRYAILTAP